MPIVFDLRRDTSANRLAYTPVSGELFFDSSTSTLFVGNAGIPGGVQVGCPSGYTIGASSYTVLDTDTGKMLVFIGTSTCAVALAAPGSSGGLYFPQQTQVVLLNLNSAEVTVTVSGSSINGSSALVLEIGQGAILVSSGNPGVGYYALVFDTVRPTKKLTTTVFSGLPSSPSAGMIACITDSTVTAWGATIAGGGTNTVFGCYKGANWTVMG